MPELAEKKAEIETRLQTAQQQRQQAEQVLNQANVAILACQANLELISELTDESSDTPVEE